MAKWMEMFLDMWIENADGKNLGNFWKTVFGFFASPGWCHCHHWDFGESQRTFHSGICGVAQAWIHHCGRFVAPWRWCEILTLGFLGCHALPDSNWSIKDFRIANGKSVIFRCVLKTVPFSQEFGCHHVRHAHRCEALYGPVPMAGISLYSLMDIAVSKWNERYHGWTRAWQHPQDESKIVDGEYDPSLLSRCSPQAQAPLQPTRERCCDGDGISIHLLMYHRTKKARKQCKMENMHTTNMNDGIIFLFPLLYSIELYCFLKRWPDRSTCRTWSEASWRWTLRSDRPSNRFRPGNCCCNHRRCYVFSLRFI